MKRWDPTKIRELMLDAGRIALEHFEKPSIEHKADRSLVTAADREVEEFLFDRLRIDDGSVGLLGEESGASADQATVDRLTQATSWIVDPIDGTAPYANGLPMWGISLGLVEEGRFRHGSLFLPRSGELFITDGDEVLYERGPRDPAYWRFEEMRALPIEERPYRSFGMVSLPFGSRSHGRFEGVNPTQAVGSAVYSVAKLILGSYIAYIAGVRLWDIAGSIPILRRLGFAMEIEEGRDLDETITDRDWILDAGSPRLYKCAAPLFIAGSRETIDYMRSHFYDGREASTATKVRKNA